MKLYKELIKLHCSMTNFRTLWLFLGWMNDRIRIESFLKLYMQVKLRLLDLTTAKVDNGSYHDVIVDANLR